MKPVTDFGGVPLDGWKSANKVALARRVGEDCGDRNGSCDSVSSCVDFVGVVGIVVLVGREALTRSGESVWRGWGSLLKGNFQDVSTSMV